MRIERVLLAQPRGFCAGVEMAVKALAQMVKVFQPPVFCYHEIVHNRLIVERFRADGVVFVDDVDDVPPGAPLMLSAHGSGPDVVAAAHDRAGFVVNAVCPLVAKVHHEARTRAAKGYTILYAGHRGHDEAEGLLAVAPGSIRLVEHDDDFEGAAGGVPDGSPVAVLAQTTLAVGDWKGMLDAAAARFPELWQASRSDLCFATTNRQQAIAAVAPRVDAIVVIGSANSSNTQALVKVAEAAGCRRVQRVDTARELDLDQLADVRVAGVTAGASAPEEMVEAVIGRLAPALGVEVIEVTDEDEYFPPPRELRQLARAVTSLLAPAASGDGDDGT